MPTGTEGPSLHVERVVKTFGAVVALADGALPVLPGGIHALTGADTARTRPRIISARSSTSRSPGAGRRLDLILPASPPVSTRFSGFIRHERGPKPDGVLR